MAVLSAFIDDSLSTNSSRPDNKKLFIYLKNCTQDSQGSSPLKQNGHLTTNTVEKAYIPNNQFLSVFMPKSPLKLSQLCIQEVQDLQDEGHLSSDNIPSDLQNKVNKKPNLNISVNGIIKLLQGLNPSKAPRPDRINPQILQKLILEIAPILQAIFSRSLVESSLPSDWLKANVSPIFKKGEKSCPANYRPISLTCIICKLMEHIITSNLVKHLDRNQILCDLKHWLSCQEVM